MSVSRKNQYIQTIRLQKEDIEALHRLCRALFGLGGRLEIAMKVAIVLGDQNHIGTFGMSGVSAICHRICSSEGGTPAINLRVLRSRVMRKTTGDQSQLFTVDMSDFGITAAQNWRHAPRKCVNQLTALDQINTMK